MTERAEWMDDLTVLRGNAQLIAGLASDDDLVAVSSWCYGFSEGLRLALMRAHYAATTEPDA